MKLARINLKQLLCRQLLIGAAVVAAGNCSIAQTPNFTVHPADDVSGEVAEAFEKEDAQELEFESDPTESEPTESEPTEQTPTLEQTPTELQTPVTHHAFPTGGGYPIDFPTVLQLAGADNWNVKIAQQRVKEASAKYCEAKNAWLPSLTFAIAYNHHEGQLQATEGPVSNVSRSSTFIGAGAGISDAPLNGGSGGPPRMFVDFSIADAIFKPLAARRVLGAEQARKNRVFNDTMLKASLAYYELVAAQAQMAAGQTNLDDATRLQTLTEAFVEAGKGTGADSSRIAVIVNNRRRALKIAEADAKVASARLATILQLDPEKLDPQQGLIALDSAAVPMPLVDLNLNLNSLISQAQALRCEIAEANAKTYSTNAQYMSEQWRPFLPNLYVGYSGGAFGGGPGSDNDGLAGRSDFDLVVSWQVRNLGFGNRARQDAGRSRVYQQKFDTERLRDSIAEQVTTTYQRVLQHQSLVGYANSNVNEAGEGLEKILQAIKGLEGMPLAAVNSLDQLAVARQEYVTSVTEYNQWQIRLLRAAGQSLAADAPLRTIANCDAQSTGCDGCEPGCSKCLDKPTSKLRNFRMLGKPNTRCQTCGGGCNVETCSNCSGGNSFTQRTTYAVSSPVLKNTPAFGLIKGSAAQRINQSSTAVFEPATTSSTTQTWHEQDRVESQTTRTASLLDRVKSARTARTSWQR